MILPEELISEVYIYTTSYTCQVHNRFRESGKINRYAYPDGHLDDPDYHQRLRDDNKCKAKKKSGDICGVKTKQEKYCKRHARLFPLT